MRTILTRRLIWSILPVLVGGLLIWGFTRRSNNTTTPTPIKPHSTVATVKEISKKTGLTFEPENFVPLDFAAQSRFLLGSEPEGNVLYRLAEQEIKEVYTFDQPIILASLSPDEKQVLVQTGRSRLTSWQIITLATNERRLLSDLRVADWLNNDILIGVTGQRKVVKKALAEAPTVLPNQPTIFANTNLTLESTEGYTLISATREEEESPWPIYWVITPQQEVITVTIPNIVQAHLSPNGEYVLAYTVSDQTMQFFNVRRRQAAPLDNAVTTTSITGLDGQQNVIVSAPPEAPKAWRIVTFTPGGKTESKNVIAPVEWPAVNFFISGEDLYVLGSGHFIKVKRADLLASQP